MIAPARKLGLGLDALLAPAPAPAAAATAPSAALVQPAAPPAFGAGPGNEVPVDAIRPNPCQPRQTFDEDDLKSLAGSIRASGVLEPLVVRRQDGSFELIAGERRLRAAKLAGLTRVPVHIRQVDDRQMLQLALVENVQRKDLNPMEKARAFKQLIALNGWTQEQAADSLSLARPTVANFMRLLELPPEVQEAVSRGTLSMGHARALLATSNRTLQIRILKDIVDQDLSVRAVEKMVAATAVPAGARASAPAKEPYMADLERRLSQFFGTRVTIQPKGKGGQMIVDWFSNDQFNAIVRKLGV
jgi:ParB family transcriptional regulator, chromosome partitioning protein